MSQNNNAAGAGAENSGADELSSPSPPMRRRIWLSCYHCDAVNPYVQYHNHNTISFRSLPCWCYNCLRFNPHWGFIVTHFANYGWNTDDNDESDLQISIEYQNTGVAGGHGRTEEEEAEIDNNGGSDDEPGEFVDYHWNMDDQQRWEDWMNSQLSEYEINSESVEEEEEEEDKCDENDYYREEIIWHYLINRDCKKCGNNKEEEDEKGEICVICQNEFEDEEVFRRLDCGHDYHYECISQWLLIKNSCPLCISTVIPSDFKSHFNYYFNYD